MNLRHVATLVSFVGLALLEVPTAHAQTPKTAWGHPDLQGTYTNKTTTPLERPEALADREFLTEEEVVTREQAALDRNAELLQAAARRGWYGHGLQTVGCPALGLREALVSPPWELMLREALDSSPCSLSQ